jgi:hypothetical protein
MSPRAALLAVILALAAGCGEAPPPPVKPPVVKAPAPVGKAPPRTPAPAGTMKVEALQRPSEQEPVLETLPDPEALRAFRRRVEEETAAKFALATKPPRVTEIALEDSARGAAAGMKLVDPTHEVTLKEGERAVLEATIAPEACATFVVQGGIGVVEVDAFLVAADRSEGVRILAQDLGTGPVAAAGGLGRCYRNPRKEPLPVEVHASVKRGAGVLLVRGYRK